MKEAKTFTDRESGTYAGLMLSLRKYRERLDVIHGFKLNQKPREIDCLIIDKLSPDDVMDNDIARIFMKHNIVEFKNPAETLTVETVWKVISYAAQYRSESTTAGNKISTGDITITLLRASKPRKAIKELIADGYLIDNPFPGIYYISGMVDIRMQIVVTGELEGDDYIPLRIQQKNVSGSDFRKFVESIKTTYSSEESDYVESILKNGLYGDTGALLEVIEEDEEMEKRWMELFKMDERLAESRKDGIEEGKKEGERERRELEAENKRLREELKKLKIAML